MVLTLVFACSFSFQPLVTLVRSYPFTKTFTHFTNVTSPSQPACLSSRSFHWPSPQNKSLINCCTASPATPFLGNEADQPLFFPTLYMMRIQSVLTKNTAFCFPVCECTVKFCFVPRVFLCVFFFLLHVEVQCLHLRRSMTKVL